MKYTSTRDPTKLYSFEEALFSGYAPDGGLFVPQELPYVVTDDMLDEKWPKMGYLELATEVLHPFLGDESIPKEKLRFILQRALQGFDTADDNLVPVVRIQTENQACPCYVAELFHGPTYCFKDLGMRATVGLLEYFSSSRRMNTSGHHGTTKVVLTAATTGDTGPAAVQAVQDLNSQHLGIVVHYPEGQISDFQRQQMTTVRSSCVRVVSFDGGGDDMDPPIKRIMTETKAEQPSTKNSNVGDASNDLLVCGVNSYNIGRPLMQMVHFVWTYLRVVQDIEKESSEKVDRDNFQLDIVIPTGAMGNMAGCYMAKQLGIPFGILNAGVNTNDFTHRTFQTGLVQKPAEGEPMKPSLSDAINIQLPYNLERLLFYLTDQNHGLIREWYQQLESKEGQFDMTAFEGSSISPCSWRTKLQSEFASARVTDSELCETMKSVLQEHGYWIDPHSGVAFAAAKQLGYIGSGPSTNSSVSKAVAIMATASPCKFQKALTAALGERQWETYECDHFPPRARDLKHIEEIPPIRYVAEKTKSLEKNQQVWEAKTRELIEELGR